MTIGPVDPETKARIDLLKLHRKRVEAEGLSRPDMLALWNELNRAIVRRTEEI